MWVCECAIVYSNRMHGIACRSLLLSPGWDQTAHAVSALLDSKKTKICPALWLIESETTLAFRAQDLPVTRRGRCQLILCTRESVQRPAGPACQCLLRQPRPDGGDWVMQVLPLISTAACARRGRTGLGQVRGSWSAYLVTFKRADWFLLLFM
jgi:hypothetical protein